jgi:hypothetical protein
MNLLYFICSFFVNYFYNDFKKIAHNVPAVYDVLAARISKCVAFAGPTKCGWNEPWEGGRRPTDLGEWNPGAAKGGGAYTDLLYDVAAFYNTFTIFIIPNKTFIIHIVLYIFL